MNLLPATLPPWSAALLKWAPHLTIAFLSGLFYVTYARLQAEQRISDGLTQQVVSIKSERDFFKTAVDQRDRLLDIQSASIDAIAAQAAADRTFYEKGLAAARELSAVNVSKANDLLALQAPDGELAQCRAARDLLESELVK